MLVTVCDSGANKRRGTLGTYQVLLSILACCGHFISTVVHAAKVRTLALEAHVVGAFKHGKGLQIVEEAVLRVTEACICV